MSRRARTSLLVLAILVTALGAVAWAGSAGRIDLSWHVLSGGGAPTASGSGRVALNGSLGQTAAGASTSADGKTHLEAGYWSSAAAGEESVYIPLILLEH